jgi:hypothetical protein
MNAGQGYYYPVNVAGFGANITASQLGMVDMSFYTNKGKGVVEFVLVSPGGTGIRLIGPYCDGGYCNDNNNSTYHPTFYPASSGYSAWNNGSNIPPGDVNFTPYGGTEAAEYTIGGILGTTFTHFVSSFDQLTGSMNGTWFLYGRKKGTPAGVVDFLGVCLRPLNCTDNELIVRTWTATDQCGNSASFVQSIIIADDSPPTLTCPADITKYVENCSEGTASVSFAATATDNCSSSVVTYDTSGVTITSPHTFPFGVTTVNVTAVDGCGNTSNCSFNVNVVAPDVTPVITAEPNIMVGSTNFDVIVQVTELLNVNTNSPVTVRLTKDIRWSFTYNPNATDINGKLVNNSDWIYTEDATYHKFTTNTSITGGFYSRFGFIALWEAGQTWGKASVTCQVDSWSGGECRIDNNSDAETLDYFIN